MPLWHIGATIEGGGYNDHTERNCTYMGIKKYKITAIDKFFI